MTKVRVCKDCGRTIDSGFLYCPWCGCSCFEENDYQSEEAVFKQLEIMQGQNREDKLAQLHNQLDELEKELDTLVLSTEMHK